MAGLKFGLLDWWPWRRWRVTGYVDAADEIPEHLPPKAMVVVGSVQRPKWIAFDCPCQRGHRIMLAAQPIEGAEDPFKAARPKWVLEAERPATLWPSVDAWHGQHRCHYIIQEGVVRWVKNLPKMPNL